MNARPSRLLFLSLGLFFLVHDPEALSQDPGKPAPAFLDTTLTFEQRAADLVSRMTLDEKISQMQNVAVAIPRLQIPVYDWWNECNHGVARNGFATVFPQVIGMAATWDPELIHQEAWVISIEARAKYSEAISKDEHKRHQGLTFWAPNIYLVRDPRWGRGQETYGEDPFLTSRMGVAFVTGLQGDNPKYLQLVSTPKHYAVHSGPEPLRHGFNAEVTKRDLYDTYLPAFEACVREGRAYSVMGAYSALDGVPDCANSFLLTEVLRNKWGFKGYVVSDCGAIGDIVKGHKYAPSLPAAAALAVKAGCDLSCGRNQYAGLSEDLKRGLITEKEIDEAVTRLMLARFKLGMFDPAAAVPFSRIQISENDTEPHRQLARKVADESIVLLKNEKNTLPLTKNLKSVAVIGKYADNIDVLVGNYNGTPSKPITILQGIKDRLGKDAAVSFVPGYNLPEDSVKTDSAGMVTDAIALTRKSDVAIVVAGISPKLEGEQLKVKLPGFEGGDRTSLDIPPDQEALIRSLHATGKKIILVLVGGSALAVNWEQEHLPAIVDAWYPGEEGGNAVADVLFGDYNPAGRLPVTFYRSVNDLPPFTDYNMEGRTYRYFRGKPLYPFGFGLNFTDFTYTSVIVSRKEVNAKDTIVVSVGVKNSGRMDGEEVVQLYARNLSAGKSEPEKSLKGFKRVAIRKGETSRVAIILPVSSLRTYDEKTDDYVVAPGRYELQVGSSSANVRQKTTISVK